MLSCSVYAPRHDVVRGPIRLNLHPPGPRRAFRCVCVCVVVVVVLVVTPLHVLCYDACVLRHDAVLIANELLDVDCYVFPE